MVKGIILAAGEGTRMKSDTSKVLHTLLSKPLIYYVVKEAKKVCDEIIIVANEKNEADIKKIFPDIKTVIQKVGDEYPYGTGYAASIALEGIKEDDGICIVLSGDVPLLRGETLEEMVSKHKKNGNSSTVLSCEMNDPSGYGRIVFGEDKKFKKIVEDKDANIEELNIKEINSGIYSFNIAELKKFIEELDMDNSQGELYLTDLIEILVENNLKVDTYKLDFKDYEQIMGINNKLQLSEVEDIMRKRINEKYMLGGVILENPNTITIEEGVEIGKDTRIGQNVSILGKSKIGSFCHIKSNSRIENSTLENNVVIDSSVIEDSYIEEGADVGPFSHLRPKAHLGKNVHIGNFVEVKNANVGENTKAGHLAYVGDADIGSNVNIGCGAIFVNYDGTFKHRSKIGDHAFIGSNANIVAPVTIEDYGYIAAGSTITKDVQKGYLAIERANQANIEGYAEKKAARDEKIKKDMQ